jgi:hypothetical protein
MVAVERVERLLLDGWMDGLGRVMAEAVALGDEEEISEREAKRNSKGD